VEYFGDIHGRVMERATPESSEHDGIVFFLRGKMENAQNFIIGPRGVLGLQHGLPRGAPGGDLSLRPVLEGCGGDEVEVEGVLEERVAFL
jgi:hypothetical protein